MNNAEFKILRKKLKLTQPKLAKLLDIATRTVQEYEYGNSKIPLAIAELLYKKVSDLGIKHSSNSDTIKMDVRGVDTISLEEMARFCIKFKKEFKEIPEIKLLIDYERKDAKAELMEKHIILKNSQNLNKN